jgi:hypothetical protein
MCLTASIVVSTDDDNASIAARRVSFDAAKKTSEVEAFQEISLDANRGGANMPN